MGCQTIWAGPTLQDFGASRRMRERERGVERERKGCKLLDLKVGCMLEFEYATSTSRLPPSTFLSSLLLSQTSLILLSLF